MPFALAVNVKALSGAIFPESKLPSWAVTVWKEVLVFLDDYVLLPHLKIIRNKFHSLHDDLGSWLLTGIPVVISVYRPRRCHGKECDEATAGR